MRVRLLLAAAAAATLTLVAAACSESPTSPGKPAAPGVRKDGDPITECRTGYIVNTRDDGSTECVPDDSSGG
jgi:hypothetical protein